MDDITLDVAEQALACVPAHDRETWVLMAMSLKSEFGESAFDVWDGWSQSDETYKPQDALAVWRSVKPGGKTGIGTLIHAAKSYGFEIKPGVLSDDERERRKQEADHRRQRVAEERRAYEQNIQVWHARVAGAAEYIWTNLLRNTGVSEYIGKKRIDNIGGRFVSTPFIYVADLVNDKVDVITGASEIRSFFADNKGVDPDKQSIRYCKRGVFVVPMRDADGKIWNIQMIFPSGAKRPLKRGKKQGNFHLAFNGSADFDAKIILIAEGYATAASLHMATGYPVAVCFDAGNIKPVASTLKARYPDHQLVIAGDDDINNPDNPGRKKATEAAAAVGARVLFPVFRGAA